MARGRMEGGGWRMEGWRRGWRKEEGREDGGVHGNGSTEDARVGGQEEHRGDRIWRDVRIRGRARCRNSAAGTMQEEEEEAERVACALCARGPRRTMLTLNPALPPLALSPSLLPSFPCFLLPSILPSLAPSSVLPPLQTPMLETPVRGPVAEGWTEAHHHEGNAWDWVQERRVQIPKFRVLGSGYRVYV
eukprot:3937305-Rhodomonas_salina.10